MQLEAEDVASIRRYARGALLSAGCDGVAPVPLDQVAQALDLSQPEDLYALGDAPDGLRQKMVRLKGKVLGALDIRERAIYLDVGQRPTTRNFHLAHELGHDALPWHADAYYGDDEFTLDPDTHERLEAEATRFGVELLFGVDAFDRQAQDYRTGLGAPLDLADIWGVARSTAIRRYVEASPRACGLLIIGGIPGLNRVKVLRAVESPTFRQRHGVLSAAISQWLPTTNSELAAAAYSMIHQRPSEPVVDGQFPLPGGDTRLRYELTTNGYQLFALLYEPSRISLGRRVRPAWAAAPSP